MARTRDIVTTGDPSNSNEVVLGDDSLIVTVNGPPIEFNVLFEDAALSTDFDCNNLYLLDMASFIPPPSGIVITTDPRLSNSRNIVAGSVTDQSVAVDAGIEQYKLNLNGSLPAYYLSSPDSIVTVTGGELLETVTGDDGLPVTAGGITQVGDHPVTVNGTTGEFVYGDDAMVVTDGYASSFPFFYAARGDLVELLSHKGIAGGYCPLDSTGRIPFLNYPPGGFSGSVNYLALSLPKEFGVSPSFFQTGAGTFATLWNPEPPNSWFGTTHVSGMPIVAQTPSFQTGPVSTEVVPNLDASSFTSGTFSIGRLPFAASTATGSNPGMVPDPGATGDPTDYLGRDMLYHAMVPPPSYEPQVPNPAITFQFWSGHSAVIIVTDPLPSASLFYRLNHAGQFVPLPTGAFNVPSGSTVEAYGAKSGYSNSTLVSLAIPPH